MKSILILLSLVFSVLLIVYLLHKGSRKWIITVSRLFLSLVFMYSGFVKAVDPLGSTYKFLDYFQAFELMWLNDLAFPLAIVLSSLEFLIGFGLLLGIFLKFYSRLATLFMLIFTPITFVLVLSNPVTDCGCFGDALILTNWETFWKNIIIDVAIVLLLLRGKHFVSKVGNQLASFLSLIGVFLIISVSVYGYMYLPILDFRPYKIGKNIQEGMVIPEGAKADVYESTFIYKNIKTGEECSFAETELSEPADHPELWEYVDSHSELIEEGYHPPIHDFTITNSLEGDITQKVLGEPMTLLCIAYDLKETDFETFVKLEELSLALQKENITTRVVTAALSKQIDIMKDSLISALSYQKLDSSQVYSVYFYEKESQIYEFTDADFPEDIDAYTFVGSEKRIEENKAQLSYEFYICDPITLKTIVRANPGFVLLKKGTVVDKWHYNDWIDFEGFKTRYLDK